MNKKILSQGKKITIQFGVCLLGKLAVILMGLVIMGCSSFRTPEIKGVVLDVETGKPIADARIYAKWERMMRGFGGESSGGIDKELRLKTKGDGTFLIPAHTLVNFIPTGKGGIFSSLYMHMSIRIYNSFSLKQAILKVQSQDMTNLKGLLQVNRWL